MEDSGLALALLRTQRRRAASAKSDTRLDRSTQGGTAAASLSLSEASCLVASSCLG